MLKTKLLSFLFFALLFTTSYECLSMHESLSKDADEILIQAVKAKDFDAAQKALEDGANPNQFIFISNGRLLLPVRLINAAVLAGDLPMAQLLTSNGACLEVPNLLTDAVSSGNTRLVKWLIDQGLNVNLGAQDPTVSSFELVKWLSGEGTNVNSSTQRPIDRAIARNDINMVRLLIERGAHVAGASINLAASAIAQSYSSPEARKNQLSLIELTLANGYSINVSIPITNLILNHDLTLIRWLLEHGSLITAFMKAVLHGNNIEGIYNEPLLDAIVFHDIERAKHLLTRYAKIRDPERLLNRYRRITEHSPQATIIHRALIVAAAQGLDNLVLAVLQDYNDILDISSIGTALERAALAGHLPVVETIYRFYAKSIQKHSDVWRSYLNRALFLAAVQRRIPVVEFLLQRDLLYNLDLDIGQAGQQIRTILANPQLQAVLRTELNTLLDVLIRYQRARSAGHIIARLQIPTYHRQEGTTFRTLPEELTQQITRRAYNIPGSSN